MPTLSFFETTSSAIAGAFLADAKPRQSRSFASSLQLAGLE